MKIHVSKEWCMESAALEAGHCVGAGLPSVLGATDQRPPEARCAASEGSALLRAMRKHRAAMAPHQRARERGQLFLDALAELERVDALMPRVHAALVQAKSLLCDKHEFEAAAELIELIKATSPNVGDVPRAELARSKSQPQ